MLLYVTDGPDVWLVPFPFIILLDCCILRSSTRVARLLDACAMFGCGVMAPSDCGAGVDAPELFCVARTDASFLLASEMICLIFLFRLLDGFHAGLRNGLAV